MIAVATKLREARALIERGWTQGGYARTVGGRIIGPKEAKASCWCSLGAIFAVTDVDDCYLVANAVEDAAETENIVHWNDAPERTQADVLAAFDRAIELAEQEAR
jgi:hypothetical protein